MTNKHLTTISSGRSAERTTTCCRAVLLVSILALSAGDLMAQGTSPWLRSD